MRDFRDGWSCRLQTEERRAQVSITGFTLSAGAAAAESELVAAAAASLNYNSVQLGALVTRLTNNVSQFFCGL